MKKFILLLSAALLFAACYNGPTQTEIDKSRADAEQAMKEQARQDSLRKVRTLELARQDSLNRVTVNRLKPLFNEKTDEFTERTWVTPKSAPKYKSTNSCYCYFQKSGGQATNLRFVFSYYADDWLFIRNLIFNVDGVNYTVIPDDMETDCGYGGHIWEWFDESAKYHNTLIAAIANAKSVKVKCNGRQYYGVRTLTAAQIKSIKDTYEYYLALNGTV